MKVELDVDEVWALLSTVTKQVVDGVDLPDEDRAALRRWRSQQMRPSSEGMRALVVKLNEDIAKLSRQRERSAIQKHDWV
ncbi:MAG TPA: hypothetical protein VIO16_09755 [Dehalococcoidia bacterium]|jgi:hypothetical protein